jgi:hypothetical protein
MRIARIAVPVAAALATAGLALAPATSAFASNTKTIHAHGLVEHFSDVVPCTSIPVDITTTSNAVQHFQVRTQPDGTVIAQGTFTETGTFVAVRTDGVDVTYTGKFTTWDGFTAFNPVFDSDGNIVSADKFSESGTFHIHGVGTDGFVISEHANEHDSSNPAGNTAQHFHDSCAA